MAPDKSPTSTPIPMMVKTAPKRKDPDALEVRILSGITEFDAAARLIGHVFSPDGVSHVPADLTVAVSLAGGYVGGAFIDNELIGVAIAFGEIRPWQHPREAPTSSLAMHSHVAAVASKARGRRVGWSLKMHQREWALARGVDTIDWTFDPLERRNGFFNMTLLGAQAIQYLPNLYGEIDDDVNRKQETDRVLVRWNLNSPEAIIAASGTLVEPAITDAEMKKSALWPSDRAPSAPQVFSGAQQMRQLCGTPTDIEALAKTDLAAALSWRRAQRAILQPALDSGAVITGMTRSGWYTLER
ncbi:GNAT family N-acetyltransferase [Nakamurella antarctica]|uniref:GNAT family N-acetyltransferase n=1 Tax=Nakamurella antarctica TaxID=1902245 RepID=A0A3G8ZQN5_9ACTN|nr:GNAT family N-acetyltransferase [Nakamurella antarctica]AZI59117.1 GNAT family N-acetyltransferase [Nakamurella antarctica]